MICEFYIDNKEKFTKELIAPIVNNKNLPQEIRDSWAEYATVLNIDKLREGL